MNAANYVDKILETLGKPLFDIGNDTKTYKRVTEDEEVKEMLKVRKKDPRRLTNSIYDFLEDREYAETKFFDEAKDVWGHMNLNPREENMYKEYFVENAVQKEFDELLKKNAIGDLKFFDKKVTVLLGKKGIGKTISQNVWLYANHRELEKRKIFWIRLDAEKLYKLLWKRGKEINTEEYF
jgi:hypothetical protein